MRQGQWYAQRRPQHVLRARVRAQSLHRFAAPPQRQLKLPVARLLAAQPQVHCRKPNSVRSEQQRRPGESALHDLPASRLCSSVCNGGGAKRRRPCAGVRQHLQAFQQARQRRRAAGCGRCCRAPSCDSGGACVRRGWSVGPRSPTKRSTFARVLRCARSHSLSESQAAVDHWRRRGRAQARTQPLRLVRPRRVSHRSRRLGRGRGAAHLYRIPARLEAPSPPDAPARERPHLFGRRPPSAMEDPLSEGTVPGDTFAGDSVRWRSSLRGELVRMAQPSHACCAAARRAAQRNLHAVALRRGGRAQAALRVATPVQRRA